MHNPNDDPDVTSGTTDGAQMETTPAPAVAHAAEVLLLLTFSRRESGVLGPPRFGSAH